MKDKYMTHTLWNAEETKQRLHDLDARLAQPQPGDQSIFTQTYLQEALREAEQLHAVPETPLKGALVSIKDLFDIKGQTTHAGTRFLGQEAPATRDADVVSNLRQAGAVVVGHTNMTELAYSGLGLNPHYGTPANAFDAQNIPGGSTSGGALSIAREMVDIAIGTDTGGSLRIPAAFNGIVGFKPTQATVSRAGCKPLSMSLDSVGPMGKSVEACQLAYDAIRHSSDQPQFSVTSELVIPQNFGFDELEPAVERQFRDVVQRLERAGHMISRESFPSLDRYKQLPVWQFSAVESCSAYDVSQESISTQMDPRVKSRMARAKDVSAVEYRKTLNLRLNLIEAFKSELGARVLLLPTTPILPPKFADLEQDDAFGRANLLALRNPSLANVLDCCSISLPSGTPKEPIGIMLTATAHRDHALLDFAASLERIVELKRL